MSTPIDQLTPPLAVTQEAYTAHSGHGSVGPVIAVLAVITILGLIAGMIGRICSGRPIMGHGQYDFESWIERKCSSCLDGRIDPPAPRQQEATASEEPTPEAEPVEIPQEIKQEEEAHRHTHGHGNGES
ncbi:uncharacterized protein LOC121254218 [Juglans microcarpa x Juglans regia]|uniref:uncharacterized protein LOC121254218 n=1 Tax=Juglans microcarpa x Juglans regia TaxID=2249226 RepID=UPI001B7E2840|nr:uncharacterized protein LOC121254218 [Juglans microcarpa x Juglans regia]